MINLEISDIQKAKLDFARRGESIADWARKNGFNQQLVYKVLSGKSRALRGECHAIAVKLGLKHP